MGKKYIIELESGIHMFVLGPEGIVHIGEPDVVYETVDGMEIGDAVINAKPYTEPDIEKARKEAYTEAKIDAGQEYENGYDAGHNVGYQQGLSDAWEAARKIALMDTETSENVTGYFGLFRIMENLTPMQAIEKIRQYEQEQQESITVEDVMRQYLDTFCKGQRNCEGCPLRTPDFTCGRGKYFLYDSMSNEEVRRAYATVIAKMKENTP